MWSYPPRRILVPIDFGDASARALRVASALAQAYRSRVTVLHADALEAPLYFTPAQVRALDRQRAAARRSAEQLMRTFAARHVDESRTDYAISEGPAAPAVVQAAGRTDLVVMGTHGRRGPARWWAGSVAERVVREADVPVLVVRASATSSATAVFKRLAVLSPGGAFEGAARRYARGLVSTFGGAITVDAIQSVDAVGDATLVVLARPGGRGGSMIGVEADALLRSCRKPVLFVPGV